MPKVAKQGLRRKSRERVAARPAPALNAGSRRPSGWQIACIAAGLAVFSLALYFPATRNQFVSYDDATYVTANPNVISGLSWKFVRWAFSSTYAANWHPLTWLSHALDCQLYGLNPAGHHFSSVALHACNVALIFLVLFRATGFLGRSAAVAALFAAHPLNVETVAWVAERKSVLSMFFFLLALLLYGWYACKPGLLRYLAVCAAFAAGLMAKPMVISLPFVLLLADYWPLQRVRGTPPTKFPGVEQTSWARLVLEKLPLFALASGSGIITIIAQRSAMMPDTLGPLGARAGNAVHAYALYLWKLFWPTRLAVFYPAKLLGFWQVVLPLLLLIVISVWAWRKRNRPYLMVGWLFFLGTLVPMIGVIQVGGQAMADRYAYLPMMGILVMLVWTVGDWADAHAATRWLWYGTVLAVIALSLVTLHQIRFWQSSYDLWAHALVVTENNFLAEENMGSTLLDLGRTAEALPYFERASAINPRDAISRSNIAADLLDRGRLREAVAEYELTLTLTSDPEIVAISHKNLGTAYRRLGDLAKSRQHYQAAAQLNPALLASLGRLLETDRAIENLRQTVERAPTEAGYLQLAQALQRARRDEEARAAYRKVLEINPHSSAAADGLKLLDVPN
jgi:protein O-mannosyl-transferase